MYKNLKTLAVECLENEITSCTGNFFMENTIFLNGSQRQKVCKNQEINRIKSKKINGMVKLCTTATNNLILS